MNTFFKFSKISLILSVLVILVFASILPNVSLGQYQDGPLVPCGTAVYPADHVNPTTGKSDAGQISNPCKFGDLLKLVNNIVGFILFRMVLPIAAIMFAYAGFLLLFSGGEQAKRTKAKSIFINVALGLIFALAAWLIVHTIFLVLGYKGASWVGF